MMTVEPMLFAISMAERPTGPGPIKAEKPPGVTPIRRMPLKLVPAVSHMLPSSKLTLSGIFVTALTL